VNISLKLKKSESLIVEEKKRNSKKFRKSKFGEMSHYHRWNFWRPVPPLDGFLGLWPFGFYGPHYGGLRVHRRRPRRRKMYAYMPKDEDDMMAYKGYDNSYDYKDTYDYDDRAYMYGGRSASKNADIFYYDDGYDDDEYDADEYGDVGFKLGPMGEHEEVRDIKDDGEVGLEGFEPISSEEYFSGVLDAIPTMEMDSVKHMRQVALSSHKVAVEHGDSDIAAGFADIAAATESRIAEEYGVSNVNELDSSDLDSETVLKAKDIEEDTLTARGLRTSLLDRLADEHDPSAILPKFRVEVKPWKKFALPRFSKDARIPEDHDYRNIIEDHDHLTYFYAITKHMHNFAKLDKLKVSGGPTRTEDVSKEFGEYVNTLASGMQVALKNQLRNWKPALKFLVVRGVAGMYGPEYGRTRGSVDNTRKIKKEFDDDFTNVMKHHIAFEKSAIDFESKTYLKGEKEDDPKISQKAEKLRQHVIKHAKEEVAPFWTRLVLFSMGQPKISVDSPIGKAIQKNFAKAWADHTDNTIAFVRTLAKTGFQKDPVQLKDDVEAMFSDGKNLGTLINSYVYGMGGEPVPLKVVHHVISIIGM